MVVILLDGDDITEHAEYRGTTFRSLADGNVGQAVVRLRDIGHTLTSSYLRAGKTLELFIDGTRQWDGWVFGVQRGWYFEPGSGRDADEPRTWTLIGFDRNLLFQKRFLHNAASPADTEIGDFPEGTSDLDAITDILDAFVDLTGDDIDLSGILEVASPGPFEAFSLGYIPAPLGALFEDAAKITGAVFCIDPSRVLRYAGDTDVTAPRPLSDIVEDGATRYREFEAALDATAMANDALVWGAGVQGAGFGRHQDSDSITDHGRWQWSEQYSAGLDLTLERRARTYVEGSPSHRRGHRYPVPVVTCVIHDHGFRAGQVVDFRSHLFGFQRDLPIRSISMSFPEPEVVRYELEMNLRIDTPYGVPDLWDSSYPPGPEGPEPRWPRPEDVTGTYQGPWPFDDYDRAQVSPSFMGLEDLADQGTVSTWTVTYPAAFADLGPLERESGIAAIIAVLVSKGGEDLAAVPDGWAQAYNVLVAGGTDPMRGIILVRQVDGTEGDSVDVTFVSPCDVLGTIYLYRDVGDVVFFGGVDDDPDEVTWPYGVGLILSIFFGKEAGFGPVTQPAGFTKLQDITSTHQLAGAEIEAGETLRSLDPDPWTGYSSVDVLTASLLLRDLDPLGRVPRPAARDAVWELTPPLSGTFDVTEQAEGAIAYTTTGIPFDVDSVGLQQALAWSSYPGSGVLDDYFTVEGDVGGPFIITGFGSYAAVDIFFSAVDAEVVEFVEGHAGLDSGAPWDGDNPYRTVGIDAGLYLVTGAGGLLISSEIGGPYEALVELPDSISPEPDAADWLPMEASVWERRERISMIDDGTFFPGDETDAGPRFVRIGKYQGGLHGAFEVRLGDSGFAQGIRVASDGDAGTVDDFLAVALPVYPMQGTFLMVWSATMLHAKLWSDEPDPTFADVLAAHPRILAMGWTAELDYTLTRDTEDVVQILKPDGSDDVFIAEIFAGDITSTVEPDWSSAPAVDDPVVDGSVTWYNAGPWSAFPPTPTTWADGHVPVLALVWPTVQNGHLYIAYPVPGGFDTDVTEPDFGSITRDDYVADGGGYWMDCGYAAANSEPADYQISVVPQARADEEPRSTIEVSMGNPSTAQGVVLPGVSMAVVV